MKCEFCYSVRVLSLCILTVGELVCTHFVRDCKHIAPTKYLCLLQFLWECLESHNVSV